MVAFTWSTLPGAASRWSRRRSGVDLNWRENEGGKKGKEEERKGGKIRPEYYVVQMEHRRQLGDGQHCSGLRNSPKKAQAGKISALLLDIRLFSVISCDLCHKSSVINTNRDTGIYL